MAMRRTCVLYDRTCREFLDVVGLSAIWSLGARGFQGVGRFAAVRGVTSWSEGLRWLSELEEPIDEVQYWGHGGWGSARVGSDHLTLASLRPQHPHRALLRAAAENIHPGGLWWFRTCQTFGSERGQDFARAFADFTGLRVAGHTHVIAWAHSGLHLICPGETPAWDPAEGQHPKREGRARWSALGAPRTIPFWRQDLPDWAEDRR